jgi:hypothetical protein
MSRSKIRAIWIAIGALVLVVIVASVVALSGESSSRHGASHPAPAAVAPGGKANAQTPATPATTRTETAPPATTAKKPPAGTPQANAGDSDPDNNGGPDDGDGAI